MNPISKSVAVVVASLSALVACGGGGGGGGTGGTGGTGGSGGTGGTGGSGGSLPAWNDGPPGHVYVYSGPLYDVDAHDGHILRQLTVPGAAVTMQADADHAYFSHADDQGNGHVYQMGTTSDTETLLTAVSYNLIGVYNRTLVGQKNESQVVSVNLDTGADTETQFPGPYSCQNGSIFEHTLYLACIQITAAGTDAGMLTYDLDASTFGPFVTVKSGADALAAASNVNGTPDGAIFTLYEGQATTGTRTVYKISGATVSTGVPIAGTADDLDEQAAIGSMVYITLYPDQTIVPFDATTMTAGTPIAIDHPRHLRAGGGVLWVSTHQHDGQLAKVNPTTGDIQFRTFQPIVSTEINALAYGG